MKNIYKLEDFLNKRENGDFGEKAAGLILLAKKGYNIPKTFLIPYEVRNRCLSNKDDGLKKLKNDIEKEIPDKCFYAVRSSSNIEDGKRFSSAGLFSTYLDIKGTSEILKAVQKIWQSLDTTNIESYVAKTGLPKNNRQMAVIIQEMINPVLSGVLFTRNPVTGFKETIIEAIEGRGDKLIQKGATPMRWVFRKERLINKSPCALSEFDDIISLLVKKSLSIESNLKFPVDIEWVYDGKEIYFVQVRNITTRGIDPLFSNRISREFMPGIIKPLVWDVNIPLVNGAWKKLLTELIGKNNINVDELAKQFYGRSYFNMGVIGDILQSIGIDRHAIEGFLGIDEEFNFKKFFKPKLKMLKHIPRLLSFIFYLLLSYEKEITVKLNVWEETIKKIKSDVEKSGSIPDLLNTYDELFNVNNEMAYYYLIAFFFSGFHYKRLESFSSLKNIKMKEVIPENTKDINPNIFLSQLKVIIEALPSETQEKIKNASYEDIKAMENINELKKEFQIFFDRFGHLSDSGNDFSVPQWKENKDAILKLINAESGNIYAHREKKEKFINRRHEKLFLKSAKCQEYKERVSFTYNLGFSLFRDLFLRIGEVLKERNFIEEREDIFYLKIDEIKDSEKINDCKKLRDVISRRKEKLKKYESVNNVPSTIFGYKEPPLLSEDNSNEFKGIPASGGYYKGKAKVIKGVQDFPKVKKGDIIVIPYSDIGWSPLFAKAGAVISQAGGMLSHSAIIAREYGIPAVVSVENICNLISDNDIIYVNGFDGTITREIILQKNEKNIT
ncbi:MAG: hypothetical protein D6734_10110 [Candidatus Schekmanbacteria bacterium]|nr:MAG: hypothetical protein D6734_10110 [Candidatus Schekmanbacteria bacterium]